MKYPVIYIKGKGDHTARFTGLTGGQIHVAGDIAAAMRTLTALRAEHACVLYEQRNPGTDCSNIRFLRSRFPETGIILITPGHLRDEERRSYLRAGVNSAMAGDVSDEDFKRTLQFMTDYTFTHRPVVHRNEEVQVFRMPLWKRAFDIAASLGAIIALSPLLLAVAVAVKLDSPGPVIYRSKRVGSNYRVFDFLKFRSMRTDADQRLKELSNLNQYAADAGKDSGTSKISLDDEEMKKLLADMESGMLFADDFAIPEEEHQQIVDTEQENAFVKIENDPPHHAAGTLPAQIQHRRTAAAVQHPARRHVGRGQPSPCHSTRPSASPATNISNASCALRDSRDCGRSKSAAAPASSPPNSASSSTSNTPAGCRPGST